MKVWRGGKQDGGIRSERDRHLTSGFKDFGSKDCQGSGFRDMYFELYLRYLIPRPSSYPLLGPKYLLSGTTYPQLRAQKDGPGTASRFSRQVAKNHHNIAKHPGPFCGKCSQFDEDLRAEQPQTLNPNSKPSLPEYIHIYTYICIILNLCRPFM